MELTLDVIQKITKGAVRVCEERGRICFHRFTQAQEELYLREKPWHYYEVFYTAGVRLHFRTNSEHLYIRLYPSRRIDDRQEAMKDCVSRSYFSLDVTVDGSYLASLDNFSQAPLPEEYTEAPFVTKVYEKDFALGAGEKTVCVYLPWSASAELEAVEVDEGATIEPIETKGKMLVFGDSITQGYDALHPSRHHIARLPDLLGTEILNKALGGSIFYPAIATYKEDIDPERILVACGTNDWSATTKEEFVENCRGFFEGLRSTYPDAKIIAITPLWRKNYMDVTACGSFFEMEKTLEQIASSIPVCTVLQGFDIVPHEEALFADKRLHPNDEGFDRYFAYLSEVLR